MSAAESARKRAIALLSCAAFASAASVRVCDPLLPEFTRAFNVSGGQAAYTVSSFALAYGICQFVYGPVGDHYGKYRVIALGALASVLGSLGAVFAPTLGWLIASRVLAGATAAAIIPLAMAWIGDHITYENRQATLARFLSGQILGVIGGQFLGGFFADTLGWRWSFAFLALVYLAAGVALLQQARRDEQAGESAQVSRPPFLPQLVSVLQIGWARVILVTVFLEGVAVFGALAFIPSYLHQRFGISLTAAGSILSPFGIGGLFYTLIARRLVTSIGERGLAVAGGVSLAVGFSLLLTGGSWHWAIPSSFVNGMGFYMLHNTLQTNATQMAPHARGSAVSTFASCYFLGQFAGVALAAVIFDVAGAVSVFAFSALVLLLLGLAFSRALSVHRKRA